MMGQRPFNHGDFSSPALLVDSSPCACHLLDWYACEERGNRRTRSRIPNSHFAGADQSNSFTSRVAGQLKPDHQRPLRRASIHGRLTSQIARGLHQLVIDEPDDRLKFMRDADIYERNLDTSSACAKLAT